MSPKRRYPATASEIAEALQRDYSVVVERCGVPYFIGESDNGDLWAWRIPLDDPQWEESTSPCFGEPEGTHADDYSTVATAIAAWIASSDMTVTAGGAC